MMDFDFLLVCARRAMPLLGLLLALCGAVRAQPDGPPPDGPPMGEQFNQQRGPSVEKELKQLTQLLALTADQQTQVKSILSDQQQKMQALFQPSTGDKDSVEAGGPPNPSEMAAKQASLKALREASRTKIAALLSADQKSKYDAYTKKRTQAEAREEQEGMPPPPPDGDGGPPPDGGGPGGGSGGGSGSGGGPGGPPAI
jgi:Spy/CpxP family protein refolding chaperone